MSIITISRQYGSDGRSVGRLAAAALGFLYIDKDLLHGVARKAEASIAEVASYDERPASVAGRIFKKLLVSDQGAPHLYTGEWGWYSVPDLYRAMEGRPEVEQRPKPLDEDTYVRLSQEVMMEWALEYDILFMGRGGQALFASGVSAFHVRVVAPKAFRLETARARDGLSQQEAGPQLKKVDGERRRYLKRHFGIEWDRPDNYHLMLNTASLGVEGAAQVLVEAAQAHFALERAVANDPPSLAENIHAESRGYGEAS